jgi:hypothetical protein
MNSFTVTTFINRPLQDVFDFTTNPANAPQWQSGSKSAKWLSDSPPGVGSVYQSVGKLLGRETKIDVEITEWNAPNLWSGKVSNGPMKIEFSNKFEPKDGGTQMVQHFKGEVGGFFNMAEGLAVKQIQKQVETDGKSLKNLLEANH